MSEWKVSEFDEMGGYDCMFAGMRVGPVRLDGRDYGQESCEDMAPSAKAQMIADAHLVSASHDMLDALKAAKELADVMEKLASGRSDDEWIWAAQEKINSAIDKATPPKPSKE